MAIIIPRTWNVNSNIDFEKFLAQKRHAWIQYIICVDHIQCFITDEHWQVGYLLENVSGDFPNIMPSMASIILDDTATGMRNYFEKAVAYLLPISEVKKKRPNKLSHGIISQVIATVSATKASKAGRGHL